MASPFAVFRRNQKILLAVVGVAAMVAFVFLDPLMRYLGRNQGQGENPVVVETRYGDLHTSELQNLIFQRQLVEQFLARLVEQAIVKQLGQSNVDMRWLGDISQQQFLAVRQRIMGRVAQGPEEAAVETMVMAERAKQMGLVISDEAIADTIKQISGDSLSGEEMQQIMGSLQSGARISVSKLFDALRTELLAAKYTELFQQSLADVPPAQRFQYFSRLNRRAKAEVLSLPVADFVSQVAEPSDAEVKELYEKHKTQLPDPTSPEPGFKEPKRATFQYFMVSREPLIEKFKPQVTDAEIEKYYEENKRDFPVTGAGGPAAEKPAEGAETKPADAPSEEKPAEEKPAEEKPAESTPPTEEAKPEEKPAEPETPATESPTEEKSAEPAPAPTEEPAATEPSAEEKPAEESPAESPQADIRTRAPFRGAGQKFRLVSTLLQEGETAPAEQPPGPALGDPAAEATTQPAEEKPADAPAVEEKKEETAGTPPADEKAAEEKPADAKPADPGDQVVAEPAVPEPQQFEPLEKVKDEIRNRLAEQKADARLNELFEELSSKMRKYVDQHDIYINAKQTNPQAKAPAPLDFGKLAEGTEAVAGEFKSVTPLQIAKEGLGKSGRLSQNNMVVPFLSFAYADSYPELRPDVSEDAEGNIYLFWKTDEEASFTPPLDQVRDKVVLAWKMIKARELAKKRGEEYAAQAKAQNKPLGELFGSQPNAKVVETPAFSWLTFGNVPARPGASPRLSEVEGLDQPGTDFMQTVFGLPAGGTGTAFNTPEDTVFVIRVKEFEPSEDQLRAEFARESPERYLGAARDERLEMYRDWIAEVNKEANVHWLRQADVRSSTEESGEGEL